MMKVRIIKRGVEQLFEITDLGTLKQAEELGRQGQACVRFTVLRSSSSQTTNVINLELREEKELPKGDGLYIEIPHAKSETIKRYHIPTDCLDEFQFATEQNKTFTFGDNTFVFVLVPTP